MSMTQLAPDSAGYPDFLARALEIAQSIAASTVREMNAFLVTDDDPFAEVDIDRHSHSGSRAIRVDVHLGKFVTAVTQSNELTELASGPITCFQEERGIAYSARDDQAHFRVIVDPLDGSSILAAFGAACVSVLVYSDLNSKKEWRLYAGAIALNSGYLFSYKVRRKSVRTTEIDAEVKAHTFDPHQAGTSNDRIVLTPFDLEDRNLRKREGVLLISASGSPTRRSRAASYLAAVLNNTKFQSYFAGNLAVFGGLVGTASMIHDPEPATLHDANYLVLLSAMGWRILDAETLAPLDIQAIFNREPQAGVTEEKAVPAITAILDSSVISVFKEGDLKADAVSA